ncbi:hypothetical protein N8I84_02420 [Streptomyces cynarae]|uniref:Uncharacterized protein n=1 Tax=Streptomyces cynarae TaxID=2981134 RepID=A0ABY6EDL8_9ACTN|nr:hypothetical protein [Streptomyces cynarae]UXY24830.1 hypothetical protein N8I84_02420 [Streptomyces cynarae]
MPLIVEFLELNTGGLLLVKEPFLCHSCALTGVNVANSTRCESVAKALLDGRMARSRFVFAARCTPLARTPRSACSRWRRQPAQPRAAVERTGNAFMNGVHAAVLVTAVCAWWALDAGAGRPPKGRRTARRSSSPAAITTSTSTYHCGNIWFMPRAAHRGDQLDSAAQPSRSA